MHKCSSGPKLAHPSDTSPPSWPSYFPSFLQRSQVWDISGKMNCLPHLSLLLIFPSLFQRLTHLEEIAASECEMGYFSECLALSGFLPQDFPEESIPLVRYP